MRITDSAEPTTEIGLLQSNKIKLTKNSRGYSWEISILSLDVDEIERLNKIMIEKFGGDDYEST